VVQLVAAAVNLAVAALVLFTEMAGQAAHVLMALTLEVVDLVALEGQILLQVMALEAVVLGKETRVA
jgi:uncharacterized protein (DUF2141 family)